MCSKYEEEKKLNPELYLIFKTFNSDNVIFDYSKKEVLTVNHNTTEKNSFYCRKKTNKINNFIKHEDIDQQYEILFRARKSKKGHYELIHPISRSKNLDISNLNRLDNSMWLILPSKEKNELYKNENKEYNLLENDIIKLGQKKYEIIKININNENSSEEINENQINKVNKKFGKVLLIPEIEYNITQNQEKEKNNNEEGFNQLKDCRVCYGSESTKENPLFNNCKCKTKIHLLCLKNYLKNHLIINENKDNTVKSFYCDKFNCEVCEEPYSLYYKFIEKNNNKNDIYSLIDGINHPKNIDYIILESLTFIKKNKNIKNIFVIKLRDRELNIGRHTDNDIIDNDMTISRYHAILKYNKNNGHITITNKSKFGVLLLIKDNVKLNIDQKIFIQMGKTYLSAEVKDSSNNKYNYENEDNGYTIFDENYISKNNKDDVTRDKSEMQTDNNSINIGNTINADF